MYEPPIEIYEMANDISEQMQEQKENYVYECIKKVGVNVNKEELVKALQYDREQYNKGYNDGMKAFAERLKEKLQWDTEFENMIVFDTDIDNVVKEMTE